MHHIREIPIDDWTAWTRVPEIDGVGDRPATAEDLLQRGMIEIHRTATHVYVDCSVLDWRDRPELPGTVLAEGFGISRGIRPSRYEQLTPSLRGKVLRARVVRGRGGRPLGRHTSRADARADPDARESLIPLEDVDPDDVIESTDEPPHRWYV